MTDHETPGAAEGARFARRAFLTAAGAGALALVLPVRLRPGGGLGLPAASSAAATREPFAVRLPIPELRTDAHIRLPMKVADVHVLPGRPTRMWTYGGSFPGPTIRRPAGERTSLTFVHKLPRSAGKLSVHLHGGHSRSKHDGQPGGLTRDQPRSAYCDISPGLSAKQAGNDVLISPGEERTYWYALMEGGEPERAAFQWYHDHRLDNTARNVWRGLAGMFILDDELDRSLPLPKGDRDIPLMIVDRSFDRHNQLTNPFDDGARPPDDGVTGRHILVNGAHLPHHHVAGRRYRLRVLNASNFRPYNLHLSNDEPLVQIATESGLMPAPVERKRVLIGPGERVELIADFRSAAGKDVELRSVPRQDGEDGPGEKPFVGPLMQFRVGRRKPDRTSVPAALRPLPAWVAGVSPSPDRTWVISIGGGFDPSWLVNGKTFDPARSDAFPVLGTTETWELTNGTGVAHLFHIHSTDWYMLSRNGLPPKPWEDCLKETFFLDAGESVVVAGHFTDHLGKFVVHCHMLDHEDHGLMSQFQVVDSPRRQPRTDEVAMRRRAGIVAPGRPRSLGLPPAGTGTAGRLELTPEAPQGEELRRLDVLIDGRTARTLEGAALERPLRLATPRGRGYRITAIGQTSAGHYVSAARSYRG